MPNLFVKSILSDPILVSRESARLLRDALIREISLLPSSNNSLVLDFQDKAGMAPSFLDELMLSIESIMKEQRKQQITLAIINLPTRLSSKFEAIARSHGISITLSSDGSWILALQIDPQPVSD